MCRWTYWGSAIGGAWMMIVGATLAAWAGKGFDGTGIAELGKVGDHVITGFGAVVLILATAGLVSVTALTRIADAEAAELERAAARHRTS